MVMVSCARLKAPPLYPIGQTKMPCSALQSFIMPSNSSTSLMSSFLLYNLASTMIRLERSSPHQASISKSI